MTNIDTWLKPLPRCETCIYWGPPKAINYAACNSNVKQWVSRIHWCSSYKLKEQSVFNDSSD